MITNPPSNSSATSHLRAEELCGERGSHQSSLTISVIVPVRNEGRYIARTLDGLLAQDYPLDSLEIFVVDGQSTDNTPGIVREYSERHPQIHLLVNPRRWSSSARNIGIRAARGDVVLVVDGHCQFNSQTYLRDLAAAFDRWEVDCVGRPQPLDVSGANQLQRAIAAARESRLGHHPDSFIYSSEERIVPAHSVGVAYRRAIFEQIGYFDEQFDACEDVELNHRVDRHGLRCVLAPSIALKYHPRSTLRGLFFQIMRYGRGRLRLLMKHPDTLSFKTLIPAIFVLGLIVTLTCPAWPAEFRQLWLVGWIIYGAAVGLEAVRLAGQQRSWSMLYLLPLVFFTIHVAAGSGLLWELMVTWLQRLGLIVDRRVCNGAR